MGLIDSIKTGLRGVVTAEALFIIKGVQAYSKYKRQRINYQTD